MKARAWRPQSKQMCLEGQIRSAVFRGVGRAGFRV